MRMREKKRIIITSLIILILISPIIYVYAASLEQDNLQSTQNLEVTKQQNEQEDYNPEQSVEVTKQQNEQEDYNPEQPEIWEKIAANIGRWLENPFNRWKFAIGTTVLILAVALIFAPWMLISLVQNTKKLGKELTGD